MPQIVRLFRVAPFAALAAIVSFPASLTAQTFDPPPIGERLWDEGEPEQGGPGAPRFMLIYPAPNTRLSYGVRLTRYAGRVDPPGATVELDGEAIRVWPGGVIAGVLAIPVGSRRVAFTARTAGGATTIERTIARRAQARGPAHRPMEFRRAGSVSPSPSGTYWLPAGRAFPVRLYGSPGHRASARFGADGAWIDLEETQATVEQGGAYRGTLTVDASVDAGAPEAIHFRLTDADTGASIEQVSGLAVRRLAPGFTQFGRIDTEFGTLFKARDGADRWGNWIEGTSFRVLERWAGRISVGDLAGGYEGRAWLEAASVRLGREGVAPNLTALPRPDVRLEGPGTPSRLTLEWALPDPAGVTFIYDPASNPWALRIDLPGIPRVEPLERRFEAGDEAGGYFRALSVGAAANGGPARALAEFRGRELWGYGLQMIGGETMRLSVRTRPDPPRPEPGRPLGGLRILIDAGHGGRDPGSIGASGLAEADVNLAVAGYLGQALEAMGAETRQMRSTNVFVELDDRVRAAWEWDPDLFISVHHNSVDMATHPAKVRGPQVYYHYDHAIPVARSVAAELTALLAPGQDPDVRHQVFRVNRNITLCPSILVEVAFICNPLDEVILRQDARLREIAGAIARGVGGMWPTSAP